MAIDCTAGAVHGGDHAVPRASDPHWVLGVVVGIALYIRERRRCEPWPSRALSCLEHSVHHEEEVREFLSCGVLNHGFTRALIPAPTEGAQVALVVPMLMLPSYALEGVATSRPFLVTAVHDHDVTEAQMVRRHRGVEALRSGGPSAVDDERSSPVGRQPLRGKAAASDVGHRPP